MLQVTTFGCMPEPRLNRTARYALSCLRHAFLALAVAAPVVAVQTYAQSIATAAIAVAATLPEAPLSQLAPHSNSAQQSSSSLAAVISGSVVDSSGAAIEGAEVALEPVVSATVSLKMRTGPSGGFVFEHVSEGSYTVVVKSPGFARYRSQALVVAAGANVQVPPIALAIATANSEITVRPTDLIAAEQVHLEERQRFLAVVPNFLTSYNYSAVPLTSKQKFSLSTRDTFDPVTLIGVTLSAGIEQINNTYPGYGDDAASFGKRFGAQLGDSLSNDYFSHAIYPALFHQDPRYFVQGSGTTKSRIMHALSYAIITRGDDGRPMPNYSSFLGDVTSGAISNLYYPHADRGLGLVFTNAAIGIAGKAGGSVLKEFFSGRLTTNVKSQPKR